MLRDIHWPPHRQFKSRTEWEPLAFFSDCLFNSLEFDLHLGFFSSSGIRVLASGFTSFLFNGGRMRLIINNILSEDDRIAIAQGLEGGYDVEYDLRNLGQIKQILSKSGRHFFECLSWLIANGRIEIKIIMPRGGMGISHTKEGVFRDGANKVSFNGSCNFSMTALIENIESIDVNCSWDGDISVSKILNTETYFEETFNEENPNVIYLNCDEVKNSISENFPVKELKDLLLQEEEINKRIEDYPLQPRLVKVLDHADEYITSLINEIEETPHFPFAEGPREYQNIAFENWKANNQKGLFAMATGTGKTITSLNCLLEIYKRASYYKAIILVPTISLVNQWEKECKKFNFSNIIKVSSQNTNWKNEVGTIGLKEKILGSDNTFSYIIICTYASFARENVFAELNRFPRNRLLLIADEAHNMGAPMIRKLLPNIIYSRRIGLSATPERQCDEIGNKDIFSFFGATEKYTFEYSMEEAIKNGVLCKYYYYPHLVTLIDEELEEYKSLTEKIAKFYTGDTDTIKNNQVLKALLLKRKRIIHKAVNKKSVFREILENRFIEKGNLKYTLIYVPEGNATDEDNADVYINHDTISDDAETTHLIEQYTSIVVNLDKKVTVAQFTSNTSDRDLLLKDFAEGKIDVLTSMKCLDEGVDVPRSELAIFCSSTGNPRQFIQRRGRILRTHPDKKIAVIHDLVVIPKINEENNCYNIERNLLRGELSRVKNFATLSENPSDTFEVLLDIMNYYKLNLYKNE